MLFSIREKLHIVDGFCDPAACAWRERIHRVFRTVVVAALIAAFAQVTLGGIVRVTGSGLGCPDWPLCHGRIVPPFEYTALMEYSHRLSASVLGLLVLGVAGLAWRFYRSNYWILLSSIMGLALVVAAAALGGFTVMTDLDRWARLFHLGLAEWVVACMVIASAVGWRVAKGSSARESRVKETLQLNVLVMAALVGTFVLILFGSYMVGYGAGSACGTWPLCGGGLVPDGTPSIIHMAHRFMAAAVGVLIAATAWSAWARRAQRPELGWAGVVLVVLFAAQVLLGAGTVWMGFSMTMKGAHLSLATLVWMALAFLATVVYAPQGWGFRRVEARPIGMAKLEHPVPVAAHQQGS